MGNITTGSTARATEFHDDYPLDLVFPDPDNHRRGGLGDLTSLTKDIGREGVKSPIMVTPHPKAPEGKLLIVFGHRRREASARAGRPGIRLIIDYGSGGNPAGGMTDDEIELARAKENLEREDLSPIEEAWIYEQRARRTGESDAQVAAFYGAIGTGKGATQGHVTKRRALLRLTEAAQNAVAKGGKDGGIGTGDGYLLSQLMVHERGAEVVDDLLRSHLAGTLGVALKQGIADAKAELGIESQTVGRRGNQPSEEAPVSTSTATATDVPTASAGLDDRGELSEPRRQPRRRRVAAYNQRTEVILRVKIPGPTYAAIVDLHIYGGRSRPGFVHHLARRIVEEVDQIVAQHDHAEEEEVSLDPGVITTE